MFASVRADRSAIRERGPIEHPDAVAWADGRLLAVSDRTPAQPTPAPRSSVPKLGPRTFVVVVSEERPPAYPAAEGPGLALANAFGVDRDRLRVLTLPRPFHAGVACAAALARLCGVVGFSALVDAIDAELSDAGVDEAARSIAHQTSSLVWDTMLADAAVLSSCLAIGPSAPRRREAARWVSIERDDVALAAPRIRASGTSRHNPTGSWGTKRPVLRPERCRRCWWICTVACPDGALALGAHGMPTVDRAHCKGCMVCVTQCPNHAIEAIDASTENANDASNAGGASNASNANDASTRVEHV